jgi:hypothetical protein
MEKQPHYNLSWIVSFQKQRYTCEMLPLETKQSGGKLLPHSDLWGGGSRGNIQQQTLQQEVLQRKNKEQHSYKIGMWNVRTLKCACCLKKFSNAQRYITD